MWVWVDQLGGVVARASISATVLSSVVMLAMLACRQPACRIALARAALVAALFLLPMLSLAPLPRFDVPATLRAVGLLPHPLLVDDARSWPCLGCADVGRRGCSRCST